MMHALVLLVFSLLFVFQNILFSTRFCPNTLNTWLFVHVCLGSRKSGDLRKHPIGRQVYNSWLYCCHLSCYWLFRHILSCIYIHEENGFLLVCTWSARVTCMNDRTDVTVRWYIYVKITFNDIYVPRNA